MFDPLTAFLFWFVQQPLMSFHPVGIYDYGAIRSLVLYRHNEFQVELFTVNPGFGFQEEHVHPDVDTYEVHVYGTIELTVNGQPSVSSTIKLVNGQDVYVTRIRETDWHGAKPMPVGGAFLSVQRWLNGVKPTSVGLNWEGTSPTPEHSRRLKELSKGGAPDGSSTQSETKE